ncbi:HEAT repeat-containing protein 6 [Chytriomyces hyalinus]|nr:HEAT repeat-containing protein 6 [Chytriomyces hyalinus]
MQLRAKYKRSKFTHSCIHLALACTAAVVMVATGFSVWKYDLTKLHTDIWVPLSTLTDTKAPYSPSEHPFCPAWEQPSIRSEQPEHWKAFDTCIDLASSDAEFKVSLCPRSGHCNAQGYVLIERVSRDACEAAYPRTRLTDDWNLDNYYRRFIGPDEFYLMFEGPQKYTPEDWVYLGKCQYKAHYRLSNPGPFSISLLHTHANFSAVNELDDVFPPLINSKLVSKFSLPVCTQCPQFDARELEMDSVSPVCDRNNAIPGGFIRLGDNLTERQQYKLENYKQPYIWIPYGCRLEQTFELHANDSCFSKRNQSVSFLGDSHVREAYNLVRFRLEGSKVAHLKRIQNAPGKQLFFSNPKQNPSNPNSIISAEDLDVSPEPPAAHLTLSTYRDPFLTTITRKTYASMKDLSTTTDAIVLTLNHWPFAGKNQTGQWTMSRYTTHVDDIFKVLDEVHGERVRLGRPPLNVIWLGVFAAHVWTRNDSTLAIRMKEKDWRTPTRLRVADKKAEEIARRRSYVRFVGGNSLTEAWQQDSRDGTHFQGLPGGGVSAVLRFLSSTPPIAHNDNKQDAAKLKRCLQSISSKTSRELDSDRVASLLAHGVSKTHYEDSAVKGGVVEAAVEYLLAVVSNFGFDNLTSTVQLMKALSQVLAEGGTLIQTKHASLLATITPFAQERVSNSNHSIQTAIRIYERKIHAIACLSNMCLKTGSKYGTSLHEPVLRVLMQALESQYAPPGSFSVSGNLVETHEKMMTTALRGVQILLAENKTIFTITTSKERLLQKKRRCLDRTMGGNGPTTTVAMYSIKIRDNSNRSGRAARHRGAPKWAGAVMRRLQTLMKGEKNDDYRISLEKLRLYALNTLQTLSKAFPKLMYSKWTLFMPTLLITAMDKTREHTMETFPAQQSLFDVMLSDACTPRVRIAAILILQSFLEGSLQYLAVAEGGKKETPSQTFTSLSQKLTDTVTDMHNVLLAIIAGKSVEMKIEVERDDSVLVAALRCLAVLIQNSPYARLTHHDLRADCFQACIEVAEDSDSVRLAQLETLAHLFDAGFIVPDVQAKSLLLNLMRPHWKPAPDTQTPPNSNLWVASLDLMSAFARNQMHWISDDWDVWIDSEVVKVGLEVGKSGRNDLVRVATMKLVEQFAKSAQPLYTGKEADSGPVTTQWWVNLLKNRVLPALEDGLFAVRALALDSLAHVPAECFDNLPGSINLAESVVKLLEDADENVRRSCCMTLGVYVTLAFFSKDTEFVYLLAHKLPALAKDADLLVRVRASWAVANLGDTLLADHVKGENRVLDELSEDIYCKLMECALLYANDNEKCRSNGVRAIGNFARISKDGCILINLEKVMASIIQNIESGPFKVRWNSCYAAYNIFQSPSFLSVHTQCTALPRLIAALARALVQSKNYKVRINAAMALSAPGCGVQIYGGVQEVERLVGVLESAMESVDDLRDTSFGEYRYRDQLNGQLKKTVRHLKREIQIGGV